MLGRGHGGAVKGVILACRRIQGFCCCSSVVLIHTGRPKHPKHQSTQSAKESLQSLGVDVMPRTGGPGGKLESRVVIRV